MATYKVEIVARHGKLHSSFFSASGPKLDPLDSPARDSVEDLVNSLSTEIEKAGLNEEGDSIIFRNIAYDNFAKLLREIRMANY